MPARRPARPRARALAAVMDHRGRSVVHGTACPTRAPAPARSPGPVLRSGSSCGRAAMPSTLASTSRGRDGVAVDLSTFLAPPHAALVANECQRGVIGDHSLLPELARAAAPVVPTIARLVAAARRTGVPPSYVEAVFEHTLGLLATLTTAAEVLRIWDAAG